jgi:hypothetical protein
LTDTYPLWTAPDGICHHNLSGHPTLTPDAHYFFTPQNPVLCDLGNPKFDDRLGKIDAAFMVFVEGVHRLLLCVRYQKHTALGSFYNTPDAARMIKGEALG